MAKSKQDLQLENDRLKDQIRKIYKYAKVKTGGDVFSSNAWQSLGSIQACCEWAIPELKNQETA